MFFFFFYVEWNEQIAFVTTISSPFSFIIEGLLHAGMKVNFENFRESPPSEERTMRAQFEHRRAEILKLIVNETNVFRYQSCRGIATRGFPASRFTVNEKCVGPEWRSARDLETNPSVTVQDSRTRSRLIIPSTGTQTHSHTRKTLCRLLIK